MRKLVLSIVSVVAAFAALATPALAAAPGSDAPTLFGAPVEFYLFGATLLRRCL